MKPFNLQEYLANPSRKVVTRSGNPVRIICTDAKYEYPIVGLVELRENDEDTCNFKEDGTFLDGYTHERDLFFSPGKREGWVSVYRNVRGAIFFSTPYSTKEEALDALYDDTDTRIDTIKVEWEE